MERLAGQSVQVVLLPADPSMTAVDFDPDLGQALPDRFTGQITHSVQLLGNGGVGSSHLLKTAQSDSNGAKAVLALARHGGVTVGLADGPGRYPLKGGSGTVATRLWSVAGAVRLALQAQDRVLGHLGERRRWAPAGPWEVSVALPGAKGTVLGALAAGWEDPERDFDPSVCAEEDPLITLELADVPRDDDARREALRRVLARVVNAFGTTTPLYLPANNTAGHVLDAY